MASRRIKKQIAELRRDHYLTHKKGVRRDDSPAAEAKIRAKIKRDRLKNKRP